MVELLLRRGANPHLANEEGSTPLWIVCSSVDYDDDLVETFFEFCDDQRLKLDARDKEGNTPLRLALECGNKKAIESLLRSGADPNVADHKGLTPLHTMCARYRDDSYLKSFLDVCDEIDARDKLGRMPLEWAVANLLPNTFDVLLDNGADPTGFVFPTKSQFDASFECKGDEDFNFFPSPLVEKKFRTRWKFKQAANALAVLERLEKRGGYELDQCDALTIVKFFAEHGYLESRAELENKSPYGTETRGQDS
ncbi:hypothetical protein TKK_0004669 [Trichogramma kaykai]